VRWFKRGGQSLWKMRNGPPREHLQTNGLMPRAASVLVTDQPPSAGASGGRWARATSLAGRRAIFAERPPVRIAINNRDPIIFQIPP
jgi:hypothetical protein